MAITTLLIVAALAAAYASGTLPSAIVVARSKGVDITTFGSGNPGASNVARALGVRWGVVVFALDAAKGAVPVALALLAGRPLAYGCAAAAVLGHIFPVTRGFHGGKGIATGGGVLLPLHPPVMLAAATSWLLLAKVSKRASVASLLVVPAVIVAIVVLGTPGWEIAALGGLAALIEARHLGNIRRLFSGTEHQISSESR